MGDRGQTEAFVTLATNDTYALGCLVLANSLRHVHTTRRIVIMVTSGVSESTRNQLSRMFDEIVEVDVLDSRDAVNLQLLGRPDLSVTFTKLHCWRLTQFNKCVFMDADTMVIQNVDELFDREELSASPDAGWPDCFNSGVFVFRPNEETYRSLIQFAMTIGTFDGGDQGLLNLYFHEWATKDINKHLPFTYNVVSQAFYSYLPAFTQFRDNIKIVHFIGAVKPWHHPYDMKTGNVMPLSGSGHSQEFLQMWWSIFMECVQPSLDPALNLGGLVGQLAGMQVQADEEGAQQEGIIVLDDQERKLAWERGQMDYLGADSFQNIQKKLDKAMAEPVSPKLHKSPKLPTSPAPEEPLEEKLEKPAKNSKEAPKKAKSPPVFSGK
ncbi:glycogenin-1-like isoform X4 [Gigantopelta aegis]|uniref:glycogenin-1-like isoform X4 n=1 Tax=Gigantopelta aegis TaxID=1735272 RepID=UPI001B88ACA5|nr:glycogenin-1-like isoform X4 [Gigantopelta aegis]